MKFGEKLKILRRKKGLTQEQVAQAIGISSRAYGSYEQSGKYPRIRERYTKLAEVLDCEPAYLMSEDEEFISEAAGQYGSRGKQQAERLVAELSGMFAGGDLSERDKDAVMAALQRAYFDCKLDNKKYARKKHPEE